MDDHRDLEQRALTAVGTLEEAIGHNEQMRTRILSLLERGERDHDGDDRTRRAEDHQPPVAPRGPP